MNGSCRNTCNLISMMCRVCLVSQLLLRRRCLFFTRCGHMPSKPLIPVRRLAGHVMGHHGRVKPKFLMRLTPTVQIRPVCVSFTLYPWLRAFSYLRRMSRTHLPKLRHPNKVSTFTQIRLLKSGGSIITSDLQSLKMRSSLSYLLCKVTQNCHGCGRNMRTLFYASVVWCPLYMNHVYIPGGLMASG